jgi:hypothetical protein
MEYLDPAVFAAKELIRKYRALKRNPLPAMAGRRIPLPEPELIT